MLKTVHANQPAGCSQTALSGASESGQLAGVLFTLALAMAFAATPSIV